MTSTTHTITADIPRHLGSGENADSDRVTATVTFTYQPPKNSKWPTLTLDCFTGDISRNDVEDWLYDSGWFVAKSHAERERHGDYE